ncbi:hypothetical protein BCR43DRAFT_268471 [Syncephalastrum racemosum]|uniref:Uncharacterized protein n=1 Tax=Syncephalastrum racemosum TaxID=13706 RepID=A0A1X2HBQ5_SYNRA|nr:hypothetical protein BCR43DRAFT_268471 [Syncephalastrum racemosum]
MVFATRAVHRSLWSASTSFRHSYYRTLPHLHSLQCRHSSSSVTRSPVKNNTLPPTHQPHYLLLIH